MEDLEMNGSIYKGKKVFITGHTGFKGSWLSALLRKLGADVTGYALPPKTEPNHFSLLQLNVSSIISDINDRSTLISQVQLHRPEIIFHLAAQPLVRTSYEDPFDTYQTNVIGTLNLLEAARVCESVKSVVVITTDKVYENKEWRRGYNEDDQLGGFDMYSSSKACCEIMVSSFRNSFLPNNKFEKEHNKLIATARAGNVIGGGDWSCDRLIPDIVRAASAGEEVEIRNPESIRPWQHVLDCLFGYLLLGEKLLQGNVSFAGPWNFAPNINEVKTVQEVALQSQSLWQRIQIKYKKPSKEYHEAVTLMLDNTRSVEQLGWKPVWNTNQSVEKTIEWYKTYYESNSVLTEDQLVEFLKAWNL